jgi:hypothetical protein
MGELCERRIAYTECMHPAYCETYTEWHPIEGASSRTRRECCVAVNAHGDCPYFVRSEPIAPRPGLRLGLWFWVLLVLASALVWWLF